MLNAKMLEIFNIFYHLWIEITFFISSLFNYFHNFHQGDLLRKHTDTSFLKLDNNNSERNPYKCTQLGAKLKNK